MNNLKLYRGYKGLTQTELAKELGLSKTTISDYETGKTLCFMPDKIAKVLGNCSAFELCGDEIFRMLPQNDDEIRLTLKMLSKLTQNETLKDELVKLSKGDIWF